MNNRDHPEQVRVTSRIGLRSLRQKGVLNYEVVSHSDSLYKMIPVDHTDDNQIELDFR